MEHFAYTSLNAHLVAATQVNNKLTVVVLAPCGVTATAIEPLLVTDNGANVLGGVGGCGYSG